MRLMLLDIIYIFQSNRIHIGVHDPMNPDANEATENRGGGERGDRRRKSLSGRRRTAGRKEGGTNGGGNGAQTHQASVSRARQPAERKHPQKHQQSGAARLGIIHSLSSAGELEENTVNGSGWVYPLISLSLSHESHPSLALYHNL